MPSFKQFEDNQNVLNFVLLEVAASVCPCSTTNRTFSKPSTYMCRKTFNEKMRTNIMVKKLADSGLSKREVHTHSVTTKLDILPKHTKNAGNNKFEGGGNTANYTA